MNRHGTTVNALLVEIMIAVLFFALCVSVLLDTFMAAHDGSVRSAAVTQAMTEARNLLEQLSVTEDGEALLAESGYLPLTGEDAPAWQHERGDGCRLVVRLSDEAGQAGTLHLARISAWDADGDEPLLQLEGARYAPMEVE